MPVILDYGQILKILLISLSLSFLATIYPFIKASKVEPINLIKWLILLELINIEQKYYQGDLPINVFDDLNFKVNEPKNIGIIGPSVQAKPRF